MDIKLILVGILILGAVIGGAYYIIEVVGFHIEDVECYDRFGNEIQGLTCDKEVSNSEWIEEFFDGDLSFLALLGIFGVLAIVIGSVLD